MRETRNQLSIFEVIPDTEMVTSLMLMFYIQTEDYRLSFSRDSTVRCYIMPLFNVICGRLLQHRSLAILPFNLGMQSKEGPH